MTDSGQRARPEALPPSHRALLVAAAEVRSHAHAPYSGYRVGAATLSADGQVQVGCNVEISAYGLTMCAERVALFAARAAGHSPAVALAIVGPGSDDAPTPPCGACRQVIVDLAPDAIVLLLAPDGSVERWRPEELLPAAFGPDHLLGRERPEDER